MVPAFRVGVLEKQSGELAFGVLMVLSP